MLIRGERVNKEDLFAEEYFLYNDEIDLMRRIKNDGHNVKVAFNAVCLAQLFFTFFTAASGPDASENIRIKKRIILIFITASLIPVPPE